MTTDIWDSMNAVIVHYDGSWYLRITIFDMAMCSELHVCAFWLFPYSYPYV